MDNNKKHRELEERSIEYIANKWKYLGLNQYHNKEIIKSEMNDEIKMRSLVKEIEKRLSPIQGKRILDVGCGIGGLVIAFRLNGGLAVGFDDDVNAIEICNLRAKYYEIEDDCFFVGDINLIPFSDNFFDLTTATGVLEHIKNLEKAIKEVSRVSKNVYIVTPNPLCPREGHYKIFWIPYMPKVIGKLYIKIRGFNPEFFENCIYTWSLHRIKKLFEQNKMKVENITDEIILAKLNNPSQIKSIFFRKIAKITAKMGVSFMIAKLYKIISPTIILVAKKNKVNDGGYYGVQ